MIFLAECARNSCYVNRWSSERRGQTDAKPRAISSSGAASAEAKPTTNREQYQACLNIAEVRRRKTKSTDGAARGEAEFTQTIPKYRANESKAKPSGQA